MGEREGAARRLFGRRHGRKLRVGREALLAAALPHYSVRLTPGVALDPAALFAPPIERFWLEIGFGGGEHLVWQAEAHPKVGLIGAEVYVNGVASLLRYVVERKLRNVRIYAEDARILLDALPSASIERVFLLHPDPWPKRRHAERRFINPANLDSLARVMRAGGELRVASDHPVYQEWTLEIMGRRRDYAWLARSAADWRERPGDWPATRYEEKALKAGRRSLYLRYQRSPDS
jgi:tRNA (guanine-N7-)-methyltransferase